MDINRHGEGARVGVRADATRDVRKVGNWGGMRVEAELQPVSCPWHGWVMLGKAEEGSQMEFARLDDGGNTHSDASSPFNSNKGQNSKHNDDGGGGRGAFIEWVNRNGAFLL